MIVIPALELRAGACVQLEGGDYDREQIPLPDPIGVAKGWARLGFPLLHVVDIDAAAERGSNADLVRDIIRDAEIPVLVGGGVRDADTIERLLLDGARNVIVGTRALEEPDWLDHVASAWAGRIVVAADVRERRVVSRAWKRKLTRHIADVIEELNDLPIAGIVVTSVHREGQLARTDIPLMEEVADVSDHPIIANGGISTMNELRSLAEAGVSGSILGVALYTGALNARVVAEEFGIGSED